MNHNFSISDFLFRLGEYLKIELDPNIENGLIINFEEKYPIQIEFLEDRIILSCKIGEILVSRFRHEVFTHALKSNCKSSAFGTLGYSDRQKMLMLFLSYPKDLPKFEEFALLFDGFTLKAKNWIEALRAGNTRLLV